MPTGDIPCDICSLYQCRSREDCGRYRAMRFATTGRWTNMSAMPKREKPERLVPRYEADDPPEQDPDRVLTKAWAPGELERIELVEYLTAYLGDEVFAKRFAGCIDLIKRKNADYTQGTESRDRIAAFRRIGGDINVPMRKVWAIFAQKHWGAVMKYVKDGHVESEPIGGRIDDLINYFVLFGCIVDEESP